MAICQSPTPSRRRLFWATQPDACGSETYCGASCGVPGLSLVNSFDALCANDCQCCPPATVNIDCPEQFIGPQRATIATNDWLRGLIINMMMTNGRMPDTECGYPAGRQGGHWSSSYITSGPTEIGTLINALPYPATVNEQLNLIQAAASATMERLVARGVAAKTEVQLEYLGNGRVQIVITVYGRSGDTANVGIVGEKIKNGWVWN